MNCHAMQNLLQFGIQFGLFGLNPPQVVRHKAIEQNAQPHANQQQTAFIFQHGQRYASSCHIMRCQDGIDGDGILHAAGKTNQQKQWEEYAECPRLIPQKREDGQTEQCHNAKGNASSQGTAAGFLSGVLNGQECNDSGRSSIF